MEVAIFDFHQQLEVAQTTNPGVVVRSGIREKITPAKKMTFVVVQSSFSPRILDISIQKTRHLCNKIYFICLRRLPRTQMRRKPSSP